MLDLYKYNLISNPKKFADIAEFMGENVEGLSVMEAAEKAIDAMFRLSKDLGIPTSLKDMGVKEEDIEYMAEMALKDGKAFSNPRKGSKQDIIEIFKSAF
jgi:1,3-propanediol dehydrogenase